MHELKYFVVNILGFYSCGVLNIESLHAFIIRQEEFKCLNREYSQMSLMEDDEFGEFMQGPSLQCAIKHIDQTRIPYVIGNYMENGTIDPELCVIDDKSANDQRENELLDNFNVPLIQVADSFNPDIWSTQFVEPDNPDVWSTQFIEPANPDVWSAQFVEPANPDVWSDQFVEPANLDVWSAQFVEPANPNVWSTQFVEPANPDVWSAQFVEPANPDVWSAQFVEPTNLDVWSAQFVEPANPEGLLHQLVDTTNPDVLSPQLIDTIHHHTMSPQRVDTSLTDELSPQLDDTTHHDVLSPQLIDTSMPDLLSPQLVDTSMPDVPSPHLVDTSMPAVPSPHLVDTSMPAVLSPQLVDTSMSDGPSPQLVDTANPNEQFKQLIDQTYHKSTFTTDRTHWWTASGNGSEEPKALASQDMKAILDNTQCDEETFADFPVSYDKCISLQGSLPSMPDRTNQCWVETGQEVTDRCRHDWECCLRCCCQVISEANVFLSSIKSSSICNEVLRSTQGLVYVSGLVEIYRIVCRVATSIQSTAISSTELEQTLKHIDIAWNNLTAFLAGASLLTQQEPQVSTHCVLKNPDIEDSQNMACGVCLLSVDSASLTTFICGETNRGKLTHFGRQYHATCANFWVNRVDKTLPTLTLSNLI